MKRRSYKLGGGFRDQRTFVIVTEGAITEVEYFEALADSQRRIKCIVLPPHDGTSSSPRAALSRAKDFANSHPFKKNDQFWLVLDTDRWPEK